MMAEGNELYQNSEKLLMERVWGIANPRREFNEYLGDMRYRGLTENLVATKARFAAAVSRIRPLAEYQRERRYNTPEFADFYGRYTAYLRQTLADFDAKLAIATKSGRRGHIKAVSTVSRR